jgi:hypothetical protein
MRHLIPIIILSLALAMSPAVSAGPNIVYKGGTVKVTVPASQYLNVFTEGSSTGAVYQQVGGPSTNSVARFTLQTTVVNQEQSLGPYSSATLVRIDAGADPVRYSIGTGGVAVPCQRVEPQTLVQAQFAPATYTNTQTMVSTDLLGGIIVGAQSTGATVTYTLPTGTLLDTASALQINQGFYWTLINTSTGAANTITVAAGTGHTIVGTSIVQSSDPTTGALYGNAARFFTRKTAANTFVTYRFN